MKDKKADFLLILLTIVLSGLMALGAFMAFKDMRQRNSDPDHFETYMVAPGDTLWAIAGKTDGADVVDKRRIVDIIETENGIRANIRPGQVIRIPVWDF